jgi:hypothetical protein
MPPKPVVPSNVVASSAIRKVAIKGCIVMVVTVNKLK